MSSTGVRESNNNDRRIIKGLIQNEAQFIQSLRVFSNTSTLSGLGSTEGEINNSPIEASGNYLSRLGDTMLGPLALNPPLDFTIEIDVNNTIDVGPLNDNAQYTSNVQLDSIQPNSFVLDIIANAVFDGQLLFLRTFAPTSPFTISQGTLGNGGNIQTGDGNDLTVGDLQTVTLIFDEALKIEANTGGSWRVLSVSSGSGAASTPPFSDAIVLLQNSVDPTKQSKFSNALITPGITRTYILPDTDTILGGLAVLTQTWLGTNIFTGPVAILDTDFFIQDGGDITKQLNFQLSGNNTGIVTTLNFTQTAARTISFPDTTTTLAGLGTAQIFTANNTFAGSETIITSTLLTIDSSLTTIGDSPSDILNLIAHVGSSILPTITDTFQIGSSSLQWSKIFIKEIDATTETTITSALLTIESALTTFGNSASDIFNFVGKIGSSLIPTLGASFDIGSVLLDWNNLFIETINAFTQTVVSSPIFSINSAQINIGNAASDAVNILGTIQTDVLLDGGKRIRSDDSTEIGIFVTNFTGSVGTAGSNQSPTVPTLSSTVANLDAAFGSEIGCHGVYNTSASLKNIAFKVLSGTWLVLACPDSSGNVISTFIT